MPKNILLILFVITLIAPNTLPAQDSLNVTLAGQIDYWDTVNDAALSEHYVYCAAGRAGLRVIDIENPENPQEIAFMDTPGEAEGLFVSNDFVYLASGQGGLRIISVQDPYDPVEIGFYDPTHWTSNAYNVVVSDEIAYLADGQAGLKTLDVSDAGNPVLMDSIITHNFGIGTTEVTVNGSCACILWAISGFGSVFSTIDISDPNNLIELDDTNLGAYSMDIESANGLVYAVQHPYGLFIFDVTEPSSIVEIGSFNQPGSDKGVSVIDEIAYLHSGTYGNWILDMVNPSAPELIANYDDYPYIMDMDISDTLGAASCGLSGLAIMDLTRPEVPDTFSTIKKPGCLNDIIVRDNYAFAIQEYDDLVIFDISSPDNPFEIGRCGLSGECMSIALEGDYCYITTYSTGCLHIVDVSELSTPIEISNRYFQFYCYGVEVAGDFAYVGVGATSRLVIVDISNPLAPVERGYINMGGNPVNLFADGNLAYVAATYGGLKLYDVSDPDNPQFVSEFSNAEDAMDVYVADDTAYIADGSVGLILVDYSDSLRPEEISTFSDVAGSVSLDFFNGYVYLACEESGIRLIDVGDPQNPAETGYYISQGIGCAVAANAEYAYVADANYFTVLDISQAVNIEQRLSPYQPFCISLLPNYPNPFNSATTITFSLNRAGKVTLNIYNIAGQSVEAVREPPLPTWYPAGTHEVTWNAERFASGVYIVRLEVLSGMRTRQHIEVRKAVLMK